MRYKIHILALSSKTVHHLDSVCNHLIYSVMYIYLLVILTRMWIEACFQENVTIKKLKMNYRIHSTQATYRIIKMY